jgi:hypothetical protein
MEYKICPDTVVVKVRSSISFMRSKPHRNLFFLDIMEYKGENED